AQTRQCSLQWRITHADVIQLHRSTDVEVAIGVETPYQGLTLIVQIVLHVKAATQVSRAGWRRDAVRPGGMPGKAHLHRFFTLIGNHCQHACYRQASAWSLSWHVISIL